MMNKIAIKTLKMLLKTVDPHTGAYDFILLAITDLEPSKGADWGDLIVN